MPAARILLISVLLAANLTGCALLYRDLEPPTTELVAIQAGSINNNLSLTLLTRLRISNPNSVDLPVEGGFFEISLNDQALADSKLGKGFIVRANSDAEVDIKVNVSLLQGLAIGINLLNNRNPKVNWQLKGYIDVGVKYLGRVPINESGAIELGVPAEKSVRS